MKGYRYYWRHVGMGSSGRWHAFERNRSLDVDESGMRFRSLCGRAGLARLGEGQARLRPPEIRRCGLCDGLEAAAFGADESLPADETRPWEG